MSGEENTGEQLTVLKCAAGYKAAKTHLIDATGQLKTEAFKAGKYFSVLQVAVGDIRELHQVLTELASAPDCFVIRGEPNPQLKIDSQSAVRRTSRKDASTGEEPSFVEKLRRFVMLDFDGIPNPGGLDPTSLEAMLYLKTLLTAEFQGVSFSYSLSSSAGLSAADTLNGHLWFYLDRAVGQQELKRWLADYPMDPALFRTVQAHYVAAPIFTGGRQDPVAERKGFVEGMQDVVAVPDIPLAPSPRAPSNYSGEGLQAATGYEAKMALLGDGHDGQGCHNVITSAIAAYLSQHGPNANRKVLKADIRRRVDAAYWDHSKRTDAYIENEISDQTLDRSIDDWVGKSMVNEAAYAPSTKLPPENARQGIDNAVGGWIGRSLSWLQMRIWGLKNLGEKSDSIFNLDQKSFARFHLPPRHAIAAQVGLGKTQVIIERLPELVANLQPLHCVLIAVPSHKLSRELLKRVQNKGLNAEIYFGPAQPDPEQPEKLMCWRHEDYAVFQSTGQGNKLCKACPFSDRCGYQRQRLLKSQVWIAAHNVIYNRRGRPIPPVDFLIIDEGPVAAGFGDAKVLELNDRPDEFASAVNGLPVGEAFKREVLKLKDSSLQRVAKQARRGIRQLKPKDLASEKGIRRAKLTLQHNRKRLDEALFYDEIRLHGPYGMRVLIDEERGKHLRWYRQKRVHSDFDVPMLILDATLQEDVLQHIIDAEQPPVGYAGTPFVDEDGSMSIDYDYPPEPVVGPVTAVQAETPHVSVRQVLFSGAASKFSDDPTGRGNIAKVRRYIEARSVGFGRVLVICQKSLEVKLQELGLPPHVETAHFNNIRGVDAWGDVDLLIVIGRTQAPPQAVEMHAEALFRSDVKSLGPEYYASAWRPFTSNDRFVRTEKHPDLKAELMRFCVCEAELIQAIGRARAVNRSETTAVQVDLINQVPLPDIEVNEVVEWNEAMPSPFEVIAGRHGLWLDPAQRYNSRFIHALLPDMATSAASLSRLKNPPFSRQTPNKNLLLGEWRLKPLFNSGRLYTRGSSRSVPVQYKHAVIHRLNPGEILPKGLQPTSFWGDLWVCVPHDHHSSIKEPVYIEPGRRRGRPRRKT